MDYKQLNINIVIGLYMNGMVLNLKLEEGKTFIQYGYVPRPMGMYFKGEDGWMAEKHGVTHYKRYKVDNYYSYRPRTTYYTGYVDSHELVAINNKPIFNATLFDSLACLSVDNDFDSLYKPSFVSEFNRPEDRHHVNGICLQEDRITHVTAFNSVNHPEHKGWKQDKSNGVLWSVSEDKAILGNLTLPHSPRQHDGDMYVCNSGEGEIIKLRSDGTVDRLYIGNFVRGCEIYGNLMVVGGSKLRSLNRVITEKVVTQDCALYFIDLDTFSLVESVDLNELLEPGDTMEFKEIFDLSILPPDTTIMPANSEYYQHTHCL